MSKLIVGQGAGGEIGICYSKDQSRVDYLPLPPNPGDPLPIIPVEGYGDMFRAVYDTDDNGVVDRVDKVLISEVENLQETLDSISSPGDKNIITRKAATNLSALKIVSEGINGVSPLNPQLAVDAMGLVGITLESGYPGQEIKIQAGGSLEDPFWNWSQGLIFAAANGGLTQTPPTTGWEIVVGFSPKPTQINLQFDEPILLA
ncbi:hypothetical protein CPT_Mendera_206 [Stenotrophomonas phage Mendera]|uniref:Uncharacterized protein n=2 Tax=Menderavirus TaxID=2843421 RepID=A0A5P8PJ18_9CAUD|nr:hypothetical protein HWC60_gp209 [Stenotrophomonas phage Mendera]YP_010667752.1 hypothetical protein PQC01_gp205 [Stenotrophomonas maltophilia phage vB_SmaM_Ps15]QXN67282.1 hypothetical protein [Stenotrophomonas phage BUCT608]QYW02721.1 hypothetical protein CPT_Marzo_203 [Stenotrophomonas phage Marzo]QFR56732.1 hypothetical protein CPT_Mendera_206 [Stenotrophomonas phage Mendera]QYC97419.1 hypothetical protein [Stenotrophomonas phage BUCT608]UMO77424.1 hypothetical protein SmaMPs15_000273 